jgi:hypothetical protein
MPKQDLVVEEAYPRKKVFLQSKSQKGEVQPASINLVSYSFLTDGFASEKPNANAGGSSTRPLIVVHGPIFLPL